MSDYGSPPPPPYGSEPPRGGQPPYGGDQPPYGGQPPYGQMPPGQPMGSPPPNNNLVWAILSTIFCCQPLGIVSIVFAAQVNGKWAAGDVAGAHASADKAKKFAIAGAVLGPIVVILYFVIVGSMLDLETAP